MAKRKLKDKLIKRESIKENIVLIENSDNYYISDNGNVYVDYGNDYFLPKKQHKVFGYFYCGIKYNGKLLSKRVHRLVAKAFIPNNNPKEFIVVGHKNNNKSDNKVSNLYWTTTRENTKKAYEDNLIKNDSGYLDSQSFPVYMLDLQGNIIKAYGSASICEKESGINISTILRQCRHLTKGKPRCGFRFRFQEEYNNDGFVL